MRLFALLLAATCIFASDFPEVFSSAGDELYENMQKYVKIKDLKIYKDRPELLEAFCTDANRTMQKGFALDKMKYDPEQGIDKGMIKSYAKELRLLGEQNNKIKKQLVKDISTLYEQGELTALRKISDAGFVLNKKMMQAIAEAEERERRLRAAPVKKEVSAAQAPQKSEVPAAEVSVNIPLPKPLPIPIPTPPVPERAIEEKKEIAVPAPRQEQPKVEKPAATKTKPTELEYYKMNLVHLKEELYTLRESSESNASAEIEDSDEREDKTACLNDITAINYWMISVLENKSDNCSLRDAIKQMKSYDKASMNSCGRESMRYIEWHGRIKPYVGKKLFEAEAGCLN